MGLVKRDWTVERIEGITLADVSKANENHDDTARLNEPSSSGAKSYSDNPTKSKKWYGCTGGADGVRKLQREGWPEGLQKAKKAIGELGVPLSKTFKRMRRRDYFGDSLDIHRVYKGDLGNAWEKRIRRPSDGVGSNVTRLLVDICANCHTTPDQMFWKGALAVCLADELEAAGRPVEIVAYSRTERCNRGGGGSDLDIVMVKEASEIIDLEKLATITALAGWFRVNVFNAKMTASKEASGALGSHVPGIPDEYKQGGDIEIPSGLHTLERAIEFGRKIIKKLNGQVADPRQPQERMGV